ncbi:MAG: flagellar basal body L-ring protein FlgH [Candidatus Loosdrechtia sp.]|uniref:flagellar basal body L-ring protein FlgH n=1 Tax=Candidatus Loosdrechtia sp. TaxID=3101272 RepID=UPI003A62872B|nr:MAG: flagellar basal body L-ring protein FlgH [Candidatus Jettenia sp. AMX2]
MCTNLIVKLIVMASIFAGICDKVIASSLWQKRAAANYNLFDDNVGRRIGDIVTIAVSESTMIDYGERSNTNNVSSVSASTDNKKFQSGLLRQLTHGENARFTDRPANSFNSEFNDDFKGEGSYDSRRSISLTITANVVEVLDNGNLVLEGRRRVSANKENYTLKLTGIARPIDISRNNVIESSKMTNVTFGLEGKGWLTRAGSKGWFNRLRDIVWPF